MVLTKGHGKLVFMGNVSVEEGKSFFAAQVLTSPDGNRCLSAGLHDLTSPDLTIASEWYVDQFRPESRTLRLSACTCLLRSNADSLTQDLL